MRVWNAGDGTLAWEDALYSAPPGDAAAHVFDAKFIGEDANHDGVRIHRIRHHCGAPAATPGARRAPRLGSLPPTPLLTSATAAR